MSRNYIELLWDSLKSRQESETTKTPRRRSEAFESRKVSHKKAFENAHTDAIHEILDNLVHLEHEFKHKILIPSKKLDLAADASTHKLNDKSNPHLRAVYRLEEAIRNLRDQLNAQLSDPFLDEDNETGAQAPTSEVPTIPDTGSDEPTMEARVVKVDESYVYYKGFHKDSANDNEVLCINGWNYANNEIWDDLGVCSIVYEPSEDKIFVFELMDPDGVEQECIATCTDVSELDDALTSFVELKEIAPEMKERFAEYIDSKRGTKSEEDEPENEPEIIDEWEFMESDPEFNGNATLLYDKGSFVSFIQKDADPENPLRYYVAAAGIDSEESDIFTEVATLEEACTWLEMNGFPVPSEEAKARMENPETINESSKMKEVKDDQTISTVAPKVKKAKIASTKETSVKKKEKGDK